MKKLLIIITLFVSSFFFISIEDVKAYEHEFEINFSYLNEDFYTIKNLSEEFIKQDNTYSDNFFIYLHGSSLKLYTIFMPLDYTYEPSITIYKAYVYLNLNFSETAQRYILSSDKLSLSTSGTASSSFSYLYRTDKSTSNFIPLYANFDISMPLDTGSLITYKYDTFTTTNLADGMDKFKTLYMLNEEYSSFINNDSFIHQEEIDKVTNFYTMVIEKIEYLAEQIASNYILLSIIGIFIITFVFLLIFRRFL